MVQTQKKDELNIFSIDLDQCDGQLFNCIWFDGFLCIVCEMLTEERQTKVVFCCCCCHFVPHITFGCNEAEHQLHCKKKRSVELSEFDKNFMNENIFGSLNNFAYEID